MTVYFSSYSQAQMAAEELAAMRTDTMDYAVRQDIAHVDGPRFYIEGVPPRDYTALSVSAKSSDHRFNIHLVKPPQEEDWESDPEAIERSVGL